MHLCNTCALAQHSCNTLRACAERAQNADALVTAWSVVKLQTLGFFWNK